MLFGVKDPRPPLHAPPVAPVTLPVIVTCGLFTQIETGAPAFAIGAGVKVTVI